MFVHTSDFCFIQVMFIFPILCKITENKIDLIKRAHFCNTREH